MYEIQKNGVILQSDAEGYLIPDCSLEKVVAPWVEAVEAARQFEVDRLGASMHSLYLRGSVARGTALAGRSDIDMFAVLFNGEKAAPPRWPPHETGAFLRRFPFVAGVESSQITLAHVQGPFHYYGFVMKVSAVCIHGEDLRDQIPRYKADAPIAEEWFRIFPHLVGLFLKDLAESRDAERNQRLCHDMMKTFLRTGMLLVMRRQLRYSRDLYPSYECFSRQYPDQERTMRRCLELAVNPIGAPELLEPLVTQFGDWMQRAGEAEFGPIELLPVSLVR